jgi:hypothetical protein
MNKAIDLIVNDKDITDLERKEVLMKIATKEIMIKCLNNKNIKVELYMKLIDNYWGFNFSDEELDSICIDNVKYSKSNWWSMMGNILTMFGTCVNFPVEFYLKLRLDKGFIFDFLYKEKKEITKLVYLPNTIRVMKMHFSNPKIINFIKTIENNTDISSKGLVLLWKHCSGISIDKDKNDLANNISFDGSVLNEIKFECKGYVQLYKELNNMDNLDNDMINHYLNLNPEEEDDIQVKTVALNIKEYENGLNGNKFKQIQNCAISFKSIYELHDIEKILELDISELVEPISLEKNIRYLYYCQKNEYLKDIKKFILEQKSGDWMKRMIKITSLMNETLVKKDITKYVNQIISLDGDTSKLTLEDKYSYYMRVTDDLNSTYVPINIKRIVVQAIKEEKLKNDKLLVCKQDIINNQTHVIETIKELNNHQVRVVEAMKERCQVIIKEVDQSADTQTDKLVKEIDLLKTELETLKKIPDNAPKWLTFDLMKAIRNATKDEKQVLSLLINN